MCDKFPNCGHLGEIMEPKYDPLVGGFFVRHCETPDLPLPSCPYQNFGCMGCTSFEKVLGALKTRIMIKHYLGKWFLEEMDEASGN